MSALSFRELLQAAHEMARSIELPVCHGCTPGHFEKQCARWMDLFIENVSTPAYRPSWYSKDVDGGGREFKVTQPFERESVLIAQVAPHPAGGRTLALVPLEVFDVDNTPPEFRPVDRDRIAELLEGQKQLQLELTHLKQMLVAREATILERLTRLLLLVSHWGIAPWIGTVRIPFVGSLLVTLQRREEELPTKAQPRKLRDEDEPPTLRDTGYDDPPTLR